MKEPVTILLHDAGHTGPTYAAIAVVWKRRSWADSVEVHSRRSWPTRGAAIAWAEQRNQKLCRRHDVLATFTHYSPADNPASDETIIRTVRDTAAALPRRPW